MLASPGIAMAGVYALAALVLWTCARGGRALWRRLTKSPRRERPRGRTRRDSGVRAGSVAVALIVIVAGLSYASAMLQPSNSTLAIRSVEWLRDNGSRGLVNQVEHSWYTLNAPSKGGPALARLPPAGVDASAASATPADGAHRRPPASPAPRAYRPPRVRPVIRPALRGEGVWHATQRRFARGRSAPMLVTTYRPDPSYPRVVAGLAWFDHKRTSIALYPGIQEPPSGSRGPHSVPLSRRRALLATFNSGFKHKDSGGGFYASGTLFEPFVRGMGTLVGFRNGHVDVRAWTGGARPGHAVSLARQNLPLIVNGGRPNPNLGDGPAWGATLGNAVLVSRSAVGVDRRGNLLYAAAPLQTVTGMARILIHAGAVRAIELDINSYWVTLNAYAFTRAMGAKALLPSMTRSASRYLSSDDRDFFAVSLRGRQ
jgi:hypothetical protein